MRVFGQSMIMLNERMPVGGLSADTISDKLGKLHDADMETGFLTIKRAESVNTCNTSSYLLCNAFDVSPYKGSRHTLLVEKPFLILEGIYAFAKVSGIEKCFVCINEIDTAALDSMTSEWDGMGLKDVSINFLIVPNTIVSSEPEHLKRLLLQYLKTQGLADLRSFYEMNNVQHQVLIYGMEKLILAAMGLRGKIYSGRLIHISGDVPEEGYFEAPEGADLRDYLKQIVDDISGIKAIQIGGAAGRIYFDFNAPVKYIRGLDGFIDDGSLKVFSNEHCIVDMTKQVAADTRRHSCGKCIFCREGLLQMELMLEDIAGSKGRDSDFAVMKEIAAHLSNYACCEYGKACGNVLSTMLHSDEEEFIRHIEKKRCNALQCKSMFTFYIKGETCLGCGACKPVCEKNAIEGDSGLIHVIDTDKCDQCLKCEAVCPNQSVARAGIVKPSTPTSPIPVGTFVAKKRGLMNKNN